MAGAITVGEGGALMHGPTHMANPLACPAALVSIDLLAGVARRADLAWRSVGSRTAWRGRGWA